MQAKAALPVVQQSALNQAFDSQAPAMNSMGSGVPSDMNLSMEMKAGHPQSQQFRGTMTNFSENMIRDARVDNYMQDRGGQMMPGDALNSYR